MRSALDNHAEVDSAGFRLRGLAFSRLDAFSDIVFGFALTLLVVSLEVPKSFEELHHTLGGFLPFSLAFGVLVLLWYAHFVFFRRFGLHDGLTIGLNMLLLFVVMFFVYPLKFYTRFFEGGTFRRDLQDHWIGVALLLLGGMAALNFIFAALYTNAYRQRTSLLLNQTELFLTRKHMLDRSVIGGVCLLSCAGIAFFPHRLKPYGLAVFAFLATFRLLRKRHARRVLGRMGA